MTERHVQSKSPKTQTVRKEQRAAAHPVTFDTVRQMALSMEDVEEGTSYRTPAFKVRGTLFARLREDPDSLVIRMEIDRREEMMAADPDTYYITDHYLNYPWMLVRLSRVHPDALRELLRMAWRFAAPKKRSRTGWQRIGRAQPRRPK
ncbi:MAG: MmcQ/YjbR family DNA-binding protein [Terriglobia bacterium]